MSSETTNRAASNTAYKVLKIWHPDCWTLNSTNGLDAEILLHSVSTTDETDMKGHFTVYGRDEKATQAVLSRAKQSAVTSSVTIQEQSHRMQRHGGCNAAAYNLFVSYDASHSIAPVLFGCGFYQAAPVRVFNGQEYWPIHTTKSHSEIEEICDAIRTEIEIELTVLEGTTPTFGFQERTSPLNKLTDRQREVFELARDRGYYSWPREVSTRELAATAGISKTTLLEHLREAEATLLKSCY